MSSEVFVSHAERAKGDVRGQELHAREASSLLQGTKKFGDRVADAFARVSISGRTRGSNDQEFLTLEGLTLATVCSAIGEHVVFILLHQSGRAVPLHREEHHDTIGAAQKSLFASGINSVAGYSA